MKNILIPTTLQHDAAQAVKIAMAMAEGESCAITLLLQQESPGSASAAFWLRSMNNTLTVSQEKVLDACYSMAHSHSNCSVKLHQQFALTGPLLRNFIESKSIGLIILPDTFRKSESEIDRYCHQLITNCKCPILQMATEYEDHKFAKALYLENENSNVQAKDISKMLNGHFSFRIVSQAKFPAPESSEEMTPVLFDTIYKNGIDLLIEMRMPGKLRRGQTKKHTALNDHFGLPVLSLYESTN